MSNHPKGKMILPTTNPNRLDVEWYAQECAWMQVELGKLKTENAALRADKERLETALGFYADKSHLYETRGSFVENDEHRYCPDGAIIEHGAVARAAIDAAMKEEGK